MLRYLAAAAILSSAPAWAQTWSAPVALGRTTEGRASLSMAASGYASAAFAYVSSGVNSVGSVAVAQLAPGGVWTGAQGGIPSTYDAWLPGVGQDFAGNSVLLANAGQFDNFNSAVMLCGVAAGILGNSCGTAATNITDARRPIVRFYGANTLTPNAAVYTLTVGGCSLIVVGTVTREEASLNRVGECAGAADFALNASGAGVIGFVNRTAAVAVANRTVSGSAVSWSPTATLYQAATGAVLGSVAVAAADDGEAIAVWSVKPTRARASQAWAATMSALGVWTSPVELSQTLCATGVAAAALPSGLTAAVFGGRLKTGCEVTVALHPAGGAFAPAQAWTSGAHASAIAATGAAGGNLAIAYDDVPAHGVFAVTGSLLAVGLPSRLGVAGVPSIASGGGWANAVWCNSLCYGATLTLP